MGARTNTRSSIHLLVTRLCEGGLVREECVTLIPAFSLGRATEINKSEEALHIYPYDVIWRYLGNKDDAMTSLRLFPGIQDDVGALNCVEYISRLEKIKEQNNYGLSVVSQHDL